MCVSSFERFLKCGFLKISALKVLFASTRAFGAFKSKTTLICMEMRESEDTNLSFSLLLLLLLSLSLSLLRSIDRAHARFVSDDFVFEEKALKN